MNSDEILRLEERITIGIEVGESHFREFKSALERNEKGEFVPRNVKEVCKDVGEALVAFANADGGELLVGVEDDGSLTGVSHRENLVQAIKGAPRSHVHSQTPVPPPVIGDIEIQGKRIIYFVVAKSTQQIHLTANGRCLRRLDRENRPVSPEKITAVREETFSREYDRAFVDGVSTGDLDVELLNNVAEQITPGFSPEKLLQYLGLAEYGQVGLRYRRAALLLFAKDIARWYPRSEVRIVRVRGSELLAGEQYNVDQDDRIVGAILYLVNEAWEALRPYLARTRFQSTGLFRESLIYPELACREALINAIVHRDYSREGIPIEIVVYDDRMDFRSPGGLLSSISLDQLKSLTRVHETRNVLMARTLRELGYVREMGEGILRMFGAMRDSELVDPELTADNQHFLVTLRSQSIFNRQDIEWLESYKEFDLDKNEQRIVLLGRGGDLLSTRAIMEVAGFIDTEDFRAFYEQLRRKGVIYNARPTVGRGGGRRREIGRFRIRPSNEAEQFLGELIHSLRSIGSATTLERDSISNLRSLLSPVSPYRDRPDTSLQALGFVDLQRRLLPKALNYVPELGQTTQPASSRLSGRIKIVKVAGYGFIEGDDQTDYFFHASEIESSIEWSTVKPNLRVSFDPAPPRQQGQQERAVGIRRL